MLGKIIAVILPLLFQLGFGKSMPTTCVWLDGLASNTTEQFLTRHFCRYGHVVKVSLFIFPLLVAHCLLSGTLGLYFPLFRRLYSTE